MAVVKRYHVTLLLCWCIFQVGSFSQQLVGKVEFEDASNAQKKLKDGSCLNVALQEATDFTTAEKELARSTDKEIKASYDKDKTLQYKIDISDLEFNATKKYTVFAVLNNGWCKKESDKIDSGEWIGEDDFLTDTKYVIDDLEKCKKENIPECRGPKISLVISKNEDESKTNDNEDNKKEDDDKKDDE